MSTPGDDSGQAGDVARWRKAERERLITARMALAIEYRTAQTLVITQQLKGLIPAAAGTIVSVYWPMRAEPDLRHWMRTAFEGGTRIALPVAVALRQPLKFREWRPGAPLAHGLWNIPYPADGADVTPTVLLVPLVGFDAQCYRLGYGGGFFDRTLAAIDAPRLAIGVGYSVASIPTIHPQPHDIPMDWIVTGASVPLKRDAL
jgi:5-formyltetrahydrofolate cyclo-ligase